ncbi:hypothetical protein [Paenibacillus sp. FSL W8-1287]|uniref:hypothetical protein n=1 Tax=Paenibacillus sp. FSL W8-1287 TaxID=2954653 RepID=UPI0030CBCC81
MSDRYYIRKSGHEAGWVYVHKSHSYEDLKTIDLINELVPGDVILKANKSDFQEIHQDIYEEIMDANSKGKDIVEVINHLVPGIF